MNTISFMAKSELLLLLIIIRDNDIFGHLVILVVHI